MYMKIKYIIASRIERSSFSHFDTFCAKTFLDNIPKG